MSQPWFKFYRSDWLGDPLLRSCSRDARAVLVDLICLMEEAEPRGYVLINGRQPSDRELASLCADPCPQSARKVLASLHELVSKGVLSRSDDGAIFSRRIVKKAKESEQNKQNGIRGGNPALKVPVNPSPVEPEKPEAKSEQPEKPARPVPAKAVYHGKRSGLTLFQWQWNEIFLRLGPQRDSFDVTAFCDATDAEIADKGTADPWRYLLDRLVTKAGLERPNLFGRKPEPERASVPGIEESARRREAMRRGAK